MDVFGEGLKMNKTDARVWFITGCSTGFGHALAEQVLARGDIAFITARDTTKIQHFADRYTDNCKLAALDVLDGVAIIRVVANAMAWKNRIDVLVNNAGYGLVGAVEEVSDGEIEKIFQTNVYSIARMVRAVLPGMRALGAGHIVNISSMGGLVGFAGMGLYSATKFAVEGLSEALALEVKPFGVKVTIVEPGPFRTRFRGGLLHAVTNMAEYEGNVGKVRKTMADPAVKQPGNPDLAASAILAAVDSATPPLRLPLGQICYDKVNEKIQSMATEMEIWRELAVATSFAD